MKNSDLQYIILEQELSEKTDNFELEKYQYYQKNKKRFDRLAEMLNKQEYWSMSREVYEFLKSWKNPTYYDSAFWGDIGSVKDKRDYETKTAKLVAQWELYSWNYDKFIWKETIENAKNKKLYK